MLLVPAENEACSLVGVDISTETGVHRGFVEAGLDGSFELVPEVKYTYEESWDVLATAATAECNERMERRGTGARSLARAIGSVYEQSQARIQKVAQVANETTFARAAVEVASAARKRARFVSHIAWGAATGDVDCPVGSWRVPLLRVGDTCTDAATGMVYVTHRSTVYELPAVSAGELPTGLQLRVGFAMDNIDSLPPMFARLPFRLRARCLHSSVTVQDAISALDVDRADSDNDDLLERVSPAIQTSKGLLRGVRRRLQLSPSMSRMLEASVEPDNVHRTLAAAGAEPDNVAQCAVDSALDCGIDTVWFFATNAAFVVLAAWREYRVLQYRATATNAAQKTMTALSQIVGMAVDLSIFFLFLTDVSMRFTCIRDADDADCAALVVIQLYTAMALLILAGVLTLRIVLACGAVRGLRANMASKADVDRICTVWIVRLFLSCCSSKTAKARQYLPPCCEETCSRLFANILTLGGYNALDYRRVFTKPNTSDVALSVVCAFVFSVALLLTQTVRRVVLGVFLSSYAIAPLLALGAHYFFGEQGFHKVDKEPV